MRATHGWSNSFDPEMCAFQPFEGEDFGTCEFAVAAVHRSQLEHVTRHGLKIAVKPGVSAGIYLSPYLPHRYEEHYAIGFEIREGDYAVIIDMQVARTVCPDDAFWHVGQDPLVEGSLTKGGMLFSTVDLPPVCILEIRSFEEEGNPLYVNFAHLSLLPHA